MELTLVRAKIEARKGNRIETVFFDTRFRNNIKQHRVYINDDGTRSNMLINTQNFIKAQERFYQIIGALWMDGYNLIRKR